jgi:hypothetical protein
MRNGEESSEESRQEARGEEEINRAKKGILAA